MGKARVHVDITVTDLEKAMRSSPNWAAGGRVIDTITTRVRWPARPTQKVTSSAWSSTTTEALRDQRRRWFHTLPALASIAKRRPRVAPTVRE
jgi:hypothetical protein